MSKKIVHYRGNVMFIHTYDDKQRAALYPINHPDSVNVTNQQEAITSEVVLHDPESGLIETKNTIYIPEGKVYHADSHTCTEAD